MNILTHLEQEHREVEQLLATLAESEAGAKRNAAISELEESLATHMAVEETFIYPLVEPLDDEMAEEADIEHDLARDGVAKLKELADKPGFGAAVEMLKGGIGHHVEEEEHEMFPKLRKEASSEIDAMDPDELEQQVKAASSRRPAKGEKAKGENQPTKAELYDKAREQDIDGRSSMSKDELARAVK